MKVGSENRTKVIIAAVLLLVALALVGNWMFGGPDAPSRAASISSDDASADKPAKAKVPGKKGSNNEEARSLDPRLRLDWLKPTEDTRYEGNGRNIFQTYVEIPKPVRDPALDHHAVIPAQPQGPPPPPPINLSFFGFASRPGEAKKIFLAEGEDIFIAREGQIVDRRYKVLHISPTAVEIEDVLNNNRQSIPLTQG